MTARQKKFCDEYLISGNATDAAIKAGYSPKTAKQTGSENLAKPDLLAGDGVQVVEDIDVSAKERLKAAELIGKRYALFSDKMDLGGAVPVVIMGDDQLED